MKPTQLPIILLLLFAGCGGRPNPSENTLSQDKSISPAQKEGTLSPMEARIEALLKEMSLVEKVGQMTQLNVSMAYTDDKKAAKFDEDKLARLMDEFQVGSFLSGGSKSLEHWRELTQTLRHVGTKHQKHGIPPLFGIDHIHGTNYITGGTMFPQAINLAATFDPALAKLVGEAGSRESSVFGPHWNFAPVLDLAANPLWPRFYETYGEDPFVASRMGEAFVTGIQNTPIPVAATAKHFLGYSDPRAGFDRAPSEISDQRLHEFFLPPFRAAVRAGVRTFMINSGEINGVPVHASKKILTDLLRKKLGFEGVIVTDWEDIIRLHTAHRIVATEKEAVFVAIDAGIDVSMTPLTTDYCKYLTELVEEGRIPMNRIDDSVRRVLKLKFELGMFDEDQPVPGFENELAKSSDVELNRTATRQSIVLLKNDGTLPLESKPRKLVLAGPNARRTGPLCGGWSVEWMTKDDSKFPKDMLTVQQALESEFDKTEVIAGDIKSIKKKAAGADAIILVLGETPYAEGFGDITDLDLPPEQIALAESALATGKPVIAVLVEGRPRTLPTIFDRLNAVVFAGLPCLEGAPAIAEVLSGKVNPSGKLPFTYPFRQGHALPYNHKHLEFSPMHQLEGEVLRYSVADFGDGLSYTKFEYSELRLNRETLSKNETLTATIEVTNRGDRDGMESVLWFIRDEVGSITRPVKSLKHFDKALLKPSETRTFEFTIVPKRDLAFPGSQGEQLLETGDFTILVGDKTASFSLL